MIAAGVVVLALVVPAQVGVPPTAALTDRVEHGDTILDASGSSDPDGTIVGYEWDLGDDGTYDLETTDPVVDIGPRQPSGEFRVRVTDNDGNTATAGIAYTHSTPLVLPRFGLRGTATRQSALAARRSGVPAVFTSNYGGLISFALYHDAKLLKVVPAQRVPEGTPVRVLIKPSARIRRRYLTPGAVEIRATYWLPGTPGPYARIERKVKLK